MVGGRLLVGIDEAGIGCLAGPLVVAAVGLREETELPRTVRDSKKLSDGQRFSLVAELHRLTEHIWMEVIDAEEINQIGSIWAAWEMAIQNILESIEQDCEPDRMILDGNRRIRGAVKLQCEVKADSRYIEVSAASILAKVEQCRLMDLLHDRVPQYGFDRHRGYCTVDHLKALEIHGVLDAHRSFYKPVERMIEDRCRSFSRPKSHTETALEAPSKLPKTGNVLSRRRPVLYKDRIKGKK